MAGTAGGGSGPTIPPPTDSGVCSISPSDLVGSVGNALNRIKELEQRVAELEAANVEANQLSDLATQVGWVGGVEYMGVEGWTQTSYGTLIPPPGVSLSSLGIFPPTIPGGANMQFVIYDEDGNLTLGADELGALFGTYVDTWNAGGAQTPSYGIARYANLFGLTYGWYSDSRGVTLGTRDETTPAEIEMTISEDGLYQVDAYATLGYVTSSSTGVRTYLFVSNSGRGNIDEISDLADDEGVDGNFVRGNVSCSGLMEGLAGSTFTAHLTKLPAGSGVTADAFGMSIYKVSDL